MASSGGRTVGGMILGLAAASAVGLVSGCQTPPPGNTGGRSDPYRTTPADQFSREVSTVTLLEFSDAAAEHIVQRIANIPEIRDSPTRVVIEIGAIDNQTRTPTSDFVLARRRLVNRLVNSDVVANVADIHESPELMDAQARRFESSPDLLDDRGGSSRTARYPAEITYVLNGYFGEASRGQGAKSLYFFEATLTNLGSRRTVMSASIDAAQVR